MQTQIGHKTTFLLWELAVFIGWTIAVVALLLTVRVQYLAVGGAVQDFASSRMQAYFGTCFGCSLI